MTAGTILLPNYLLFVLSGIRGFLFFTTIVTIVVSLRRRKEQETKSKLKVITFQFFLKIYRCWLKQNSISFSQQNCVNQMSFWCSLRSDFDKLCRFKNLKKATVRWFNIWEEFLHSDEQIPLRLMATKQIIFCQMMLYTLIFYLWCKSRIYMRTLLEDTFIPITFDLILAKRKPQ